MKNNNLPFILMILFFASNWLVSADRVSSSLDVNRHKLIPTQQQHLNLKNIKKLTMDQLRNLLQHQNILIVDARSFDEMTKAVIKDSIWVGFFTNKTWNKWFKKNIQNDKKIVLYGSLSELQPILKTLESIGKKNIVGKIDFDISDWKGKKLPCEEPQFVNKITKDMTILDVRQPQQWKKGIVKGSTLIQLRKLVDKIDKLDYKKTYILVCRTGCRANIAMRILKPFGFKVKVYNHKFDELFKSNWCQLGNY